VHEQKGFVIAAAVAVAIVSSGDARLASAQKDAAEKAREGGIDHWIEYYKTEQRKSPAAPAEPPDRNVPPAKSEPATSVPAKAEQK
jgi:hypothetical protein